MLSALKLVLKSALPWAPHTQREKWIIQRARWMAELDMLYDTHSCMDGTPLLEKYNTYIRIVTRRNRLKRAIEYLTYRLTREGVRPWEEK